MVVVHQNQIPISFDDDDGDAEDRVELLVLHHAPDPTSAQSNYYNADTIVDDTATD